MAAQTRARWRSLFCYRFRGPETNPFGKLLTRISPSTLHATREWTAQQTTVFARQWGDSPHRPQIVLHDNGAAFSAPFKQALRAQGTQPHRLQLQTPNMNAYAEQFIQTLQQECLDHFLVFGTRHMDHLLERHLEHYHAEQPHQLIGNTRPMSTRNSSLADPALR